MDRDDFDEQLRILSTIIYNTPSIDLFESSADFSPPTIAPQIPFNVSRLFQMAGVEADEKCKIIIREYIFSRIREFARLEEITRNSLKSALPNPIILEKMNWIELLF